MKKYSRYTRTLIALLISLFLVAALTGCVKSKPTTISVYDLKQKAEGVDKAIAESNRELLKESFDREYKDKLYLEDFGNLNEELSEKYLEKLDKELLEDVRFPHFTRSEMKFYNLSLKELRDGDITEENVISNPEEHLRNFELEIFMFATEEERSDEEMFELNERLLALNETLKVTGVKHDISWKIYDSVILNNTSIQEIREMERPRNLLDKENLLLNDTHYTEERFTKYKYEYKSTPYRERVLRYKNYLFDKYKIKFMPTSTDRIGKYMYAPIYDLSLNFEVSGEFDRFLTLLSQKLLSDKVYEIIDSENAGDYIGAFVVPNDSNDVSMNAKEMDLSKPLDELEFINSFDGHYDVSLIYLATDERDIDYEVLKTISSKIVNLLDKKEDRMIISFFIDFYIVKDESEKTLITDLLYDNRLTERNIKREIGIENIYKNMYIRRWENEAFKYLDIYCEKLSYFLFVTRDPIELSNEEFKRIFSEYSEF